MAGIDIPTLCYLKDINEIGACRICVVEVKGARSLVASCVYPVNEGMEVYHQYTEGSQIQKTDAGTDPFHSRTEVPFLCTQQQL